MELNDLKIGMIVYHKDVYDYREPLKIITIKENEIEIEGDLSGGTHNVCQRCFLPISGTSFIYNYGYKLDCREKAVAIEELAKPITDRHQDTMTETMFDLLDMVFMLTNDVSLNKCL